MDTSSSPSSPGQSRCPSCKDGGFIRRAVPVGHPDFGRALPCACLRRAQAAHQRDRLLRTSNLGPLARLTFANLHEEGRSADPVEREHYRQVCAAARQYAQAPQGWLVLTGPSGSGKTHLAAAIATGQLDRGKAVYFTFVPDLLDHLRAAFGPSSTVSSDELFETVRTTPLLVLDDFGAHWSTPWAQEKLDQLLHYRYQARLPTVITLATTLDELERPVQARLRDPELVQTLQLGKLRSAQLQRIGDLDLPFLAPMTFATFDPARQELTPEEGENLHTIYAMTQLFAQAPEGWLVLLGPSGCGKTHLAVAIAHERVRQRQPVLFAVVPDLLDYLRSTFAPDSPVASDHLFAEVRTTSLLILDDWGAQVSSPWAQAKLDQLLHDRYQARLPTVITTDQPLEDREGRLASRVRDRRLSLVFRIAAPDYRAASPGPSLPPGPSLRLVARADHPGASPPSTAPSTAGAS